jgi:hypothetical protein
MTTSSILGGSRGINGHGKQRAQMNPPVRLKCVFENHNAMKFYEKNGWKKVVEEGKLGEKYWVLVYEWGSSLT